jgi:hypothetical protein
MLLLLLRALQVLLQDGRRWLSHGPSQQRMSAVCAGKQEQQQGALRRIRLTAASKGVRDTSSAAAAATLLWQPHVSALAPWTSSSESLLPATFRPRPNYHHHCATCLKSRQSLLLHRCSYIISTVLEPSHLGTAGLGRGDINIPRARFAHLAFGWARPASWQAAAWKTRCSLFG